MSKVVRAVVGIGLIVVGVFMGGTTWPLAVMALGGGIAATALQPKISAPAVSEATAGRLNKTLEPECYRKIAFGRTALGTDTRYWEAYGADQSNYDEIIALAGHAITSFEALYIEDELVTFDGSNNATGTYAGALSIDTSLEGVTATTMADIGAGSKWTTAAGESASMTGIAYMALKWVWSQEKLPRGFPTRITAVGKGAPVYDVRLDGTRGGTGSHRADDQSTWAFTTTDSNGEPIGRNPALQILHYLLGWYVQNPDTSEWVLVHGMGIDPDDIDFASFITAANECEAEEYYADCLLSTGDNHATNLGVLEQACAGKVSDAGGLYTLRIQVDDFDGSLTEFTDDDIVGECDWRPEMPLSQSAYNQIAGQFIDPDALYQLRPLPLMRDVAYETADGEKVRTNVRLDAVQDGDQGQKLLRIRLNKSRQKGMFEAPFGWRAVNVSVGQPVKLTLSRFGFDERYFRVRAKKVDPGGAVWLALETDHPDVYTGGTISTQPTVATGAGYDPTSVATPTSDQWEGEGGSVTVSGGAEVPAVTISTGEAAQPAGITGILIYTSQASNSGPWNLKGEYPPGTESVILEGLLAAETYYVRLAYRNAFGVIDPASASLILGPYTTGSLVATDAVSVGGVASDRVVQAVDDADVLALTLLEEALNRREDAIRRAAAVQTSADTQFAAARDALNDATGRADSLLAEALGNIAGDVTAISSAYQSEDAALEALISTTAAAVVTEANARATAITGLQVQIDALDNEVDLSGYATITYVDDVVATEAGARATAVTNLQAQIDALDPTGDGPDFSAYATITYVDDVVATEAGARATAITALEAAYQAADTALQADIDTRATVTYVTSAIADETGARSAAEAILEAQALWGGKQDVSDAIDFFTESLHGLDWSDGNLDDWTETALTGVGAVVYSTTNPAYFGARERFRPQPGRRYHCRVRWRYVSGTPGTVNIGFMATDADSGAAVGGRWQAFSAAGVGLWSDSAHEILTTDAMAEESWRPIFGRTGATGRIEISSLVWRDVTITRALYDEVVEAVASEETARVTAVTNLQAQIDVLNPDGEIDLSSVASITYVDEAVADESAARATAITALQAAYQAADATLASIIYVDEAVADETSARATAISALEAAFEAADTALGVQISARASITYVDTAIATEAASRATALTTLEAAIDADVAVVASDLATVEASVDTLLAARLIRVGSGENYAGVQYSFLDSGGEVATEIRNFGHLWAFGETIDDPRFFIDGINKVVYGVADDETTRTFELDFADDGRLRLRKPDGTTLFDSANGGVTIDGVPAESRSQLGSLGTATNTTLSGLTLLCTSSIADMWASGMLMASGYLFISTGDNETGASQTGSWTLELVKAGEASVVIDSGTYTTAQATPADDFEASIRFAEPAEVPFGGDVSLQLKAGSVGTASARVRLTRSL